MEKLKEKQEQRTVCLFEDESYLSEQKKLFSQSIQLIEKSLGLFEKILDEPVHVLDFGQFLNNPAEVIHRIFLDQVSVPDGMNKEKFLQLVELPDTTQIEVLLDSAKFRNAEFYNYDPDNEKKVTFSDRVLDVVNFKNIYATETEAKLYKKFTKLIDISNELVEHNGNFRKIIRYGHQSAIDITEYPLGKYKPNLEAFLNFCRYNH